MNDRATSRPVTIALAGNPNVGKSTIFNGLTGLRQHTGNWPGKTVASARGTFVIDSDEFLVVDLPGTYSLNAYSEEEVIARDYICSGEADMSMIVCDATCLERGLHLLKQIIALDYIRDTGTPLILCINLCDEAGKKGICIDLELLQDVLHIPVLCICARQPESFELIRETLQENKSAHFSYDCLDFNPKLLARETVQYTRPNYRKREEMIDRIVTGELTGGLIMFCMLLGVFWLTMAGANLPSALLWDIFFWLEGKLAAGLLLLHTPVWLINMLVYGVYRVLAWVVAVMLPPMAIFFPLFTLLEDLGYLLRIAFNMDRAFQKCRRCHRLPDYRFAIRTLHYIHDKKHTNRFLSLNVCLLILAMLNGLIDRYNSQDPQQKEGNFRSHTHQAMIPAIIFQKLYIYLATGIS